MDLVWMDYTRCTALDNYLDAEYVVNTEYYIYVYSNNLPRWMPLFSLVYVLTTTIKEPIKTTLVILGAL